MSVFDGLAEALSGALESAKDVPVEKIATVGLILIAGAAIAAKAIAGGASAAIGSAKDITDAVIKR